ncbi:hypothetical protein SCB17_000914 [Clostridium perfringens]|uniref:hypothetical protein n=1 Tax=Clostridium perfringens TaxID=1502 RepID=UPI00296BDB5A|nr:hypothetical protein [Clostridium perfringens]
MGCKLDFNNILKIQDIHEDTNFWLVRSKSGIFYDEYKENSFIGLGWNFITAENIITEPSEEFEDFKETISTMYGAKQPTSIINKCDRFINEMKSGDIVMIPSSHNDKILFAKIGDYYIENIPVTKEIEVISRIDTNEDFRIEEDCPYSKRRHITIIREIDGSRINPNLYKALASYHGLSKINKYAEFILRSIYILYKYKDNLYFVLPIEKKDSINSRTLAEFILNITDILEYTDKKINISSKVDLNSPGDYLTVINNAVEILSSNDFLGCLTTIIATVCTSKYGPDILKTVLGFITDCRKQNLEKKKIESQLKNEELDRKIKDADLQEKLLKLSELTQSLEVNESRVSNVINFNEIRPNHLDE